MQQQPRKIRWQNYKYYEILLLQGLHFYTLERDYQTIYKDFCLLSYLTKICNVRILDRIKKYGKSIDKFQICSQKLDDSNQIISPIKYLSLIKKDQFDCKIKLELQYRIDDQESDSKEKQIRVTFEKITEQLNKYIKIYIDDQSQRFAQYFEKIQLDVDSQRINHVSAFSSNMLQIPYMEPASERNKKIEGKHLSIALQGGGVKGISYIGAKEALKEVMNETPIKSVIGSSAGGIIGLSLCCEMTVSEIQELIVSLSEIPKKDKRYPSKTLQQIFITEEQEKEILQIGIQGEVQKVQFIENLREKKMLQVVKQYFQKYGLIDSHLLNQFELIFKKPSFHRLILDFLEEFNPDIKELLSHRDRIFLYGLLNAKLMSGKEVEKIAKACLISFRRKNRLETEEEDQSWASSITLKQFYKLQNIQFTCTAVDIKNHVLRFFNHKTTPDLPVCKAIQMTGSFPFAFEAQEWQEKWGKYYIHYQKARRQIDLNGVKFTDGGMLANFPIKYLDNDKMRPKYFSHERSKENTILYGFGLHSIGKEAEKKEKKANLKEKWQRIYKFVFSQLKTLKNYFNGVKGFFTSNKKEVIIKGGQIKEKEKQKSLPSKFFDGMASIFSKKKQNKKQEINVEIPLIQFAIDLIKTYIYSKDHLTEQCFAFQLFQMPEIKKGQNFEQMLQKLDYSNFKNKVRNDQVFTQFAKMTKPLFQISGEQKYDPYKTLMHNLEYVKNELEKRKYTEKNAVQLSNLFINLVQPYLYYRSQNKKPQDQKHQRQLNQTFNHHIAKAYIIKRSRIFAHSHLRKDFSRLKKAVENATKYFSEKYESIETQFNRRQRSLMAEAIGSHYRQQKREIQSLKNQIQNYHLDLDHSNDFKSYKNMKDEVIYKFFSLHKKCFVTNFEDVQKLFQKIENSALVELSLHYKFWQTKPYTKQYIQRIINRNYKRQNLQTRENKGVHLVMKSTGLSEIYFLKHFQLVKQTLSNYDPSLEITSMTGSNYHSIAMFLLSTQFSLQRITEQLWKVRQKIKINDKMSQKFDSYKWTRPKNLQIKQLSEQIWKDRYNIFSQITTQLENLFENNQQQQFDQFLNTYDKLHYRKMQNSSYLISQILQNSLSYVTDIMHQKEQTSNLNEIIREKAKKLVLNIPHTNKAEFEKNINKKCEALEYFFKLIINKFEGVIRHILCCSPNVKEHFNRHMTFNQQKEAWKGLVISEIFSAVKIKSYICDLLNELKLKPQTTLKEFYDLSKKIHLNFAVVQSEKNTVSFLNHKTRPYMPVWAAIVATSSLPHFYKPLQQRNEWRYAPSQDYEKRNAISEFSTKNQNQNHIQSADFLLKIPLELITNEKVKEIITDKKDEIFLTFKYNQQKKSNQNKIQTFQFSTSHDPMTISDIVSIIWNFWGIDNVWESLQSISNLSDSINSLIQYKDSHDNLIKNIYDTELSFLPISLDTLDFNKATTRENNTTSISYESKKAMIQAFYVIKEKLENSEKLQKKMGIQESIDKSIYFGIERVQDKLILRFFSIESPKRALEQKYKILYKFQTSLKRQNSKFKVLEKSELEIEERYLHLEIKFLEKHQNTEKMNFFYHYLDLSHIIAGKQVIHEQNFIVYKLCYSKYNEIHEINSELPEFNLGIIENGPDIQVSSYCMDEKPAKKFYCDNCYQLSFQQIKQYGQCSKCKSRTRLFFKCTTCTDQYRYCLKCKYQPTVQNGRLVCPIVGADDQPHEITKEENRMSLMLQNEARIQFIKCDFCSGVGLEYYYDSICGIDICGECRFNLFLFKNNR